MLSKWKDSYLEYEGLQARWPPEGLGLLRNMVYWAEPPEFWLEQYILPRPDDSLLAEAARLRPVFREAMGLVSFPRPEPLEDVYHAAIYLASDPRHWEQSGHYYRGQRTREWPALPSLYRVPRDEKELLQDEYDGRLNKLAAFAEALDLQFPHRFDPYQCIAIGQHYGLPTWLLDLTTDPWVALFFASWQGESGHVGVLTQFSGDEWERMSCGGENSLGAMTLIAVPGVPRLEAQKALFLNGSHPDFIEQYVAKKVEFKQTQGLVFESEYRAVSKVKLLSDDESFATFTKGWLSVDAPAPARPLAVQPLRSARRPLQARDYREILQTLILERDPGHVVSEEMNSHFNFLCRFHAEAQRPSYGIPIHQRSIHQLLSTADLIFANQHFSVEWLPGQYRFDSKVQQQVLANLEAGDVE
jgi:FRG domain-containing protein